MKKMKTLSLILLMCLGLIACTESNNKTEPAPEPAGSEANVARDGIFIHITESYADPHRVLMPLKMASMMAMDKDVLIYMDIHAVELVVKGAKDISYGNFETCQTYLRQLVEKGVGIYACPTCLELAGFKVEDLIPGVQPAQKEKFFAFTKGKIISLDY